MSVTITLLYSPDPREGYPYDEEEWLCPRCRQDRMHCDCEDSNDS